MKEIKIEKEDIAENSPKRDIHRERLEYHRNRKKPIRSIIQFWKAKDLSFSKKIRFTAGRFRLMAIWIISIFREVKNYGSNIKSRYDVSLTTQFIRQVYMQFALGIKYSFYRKYLLFKKGRWKNVHNFTYKNEDLDKDFMAVAIPESVGNWYQYDPTHDKIEFYEHCRRHGIHSPEILSVVDVNDDYEETIKSLASINTPFFIKSINGSGGKGATKFRVNENKFVDTNGVVLDMHELIKFIKSIKPAKDSLLKKKGVFILQPVIENHESWKPFTTGALASCRILTARSPYSDDIITVSATMKLPHGRSVTDNMSSGGIACSVDLESGELGMGVAEQPLNGLYEFEVHPDTGQKIKGITLPYWKELVKFTSDVHETIDFIFVAWDIALSTEGFTVLEGNGIWASPILEVPTNCPMSDSIYAELYNTWVYKFSEQITSKKITKMRN